MNLSIYLPEGLKGRFDNYLKSKGINRNAAIRKAIELLLQQEEKASWGKWINQLEADQDLPEFESFRSELKKPSDHIF
ncbi:MAG: hypothetical protein KI790_07985 [Cyclobacteriaceae bacterium]|nr:hypothetical protein [Cyclobacteriaceae bacterium HetDA_MAG_MS6]